MKFYKSKILRQLANSSYSKWRPDKELFFNTKIAFLSFIAESPWSMLWSMWESLERVRSVNVTGTHQYITTDLKESPASFNFLFCIDTPSSDYFIDLTRKNIFCLLIKSGENTLGKREQPSSNKNWHLHD